MGEEAGFKVQLQHSPGRTEENQRKFLQEEPDPKPKF